MIAQEFMDTPQKTPNNNFQYKFSKNENFPNTSNNINFT